MATICQHQNCCAESLVRWAEGKAAAISTSLLRLAARIAGAPGSLRAPVRFIAVDAGKARELLGWTPPSSVTRSWRARQAGIWP